MIDIDMVKFEFEHIKSLFRAQRMGFGAKTVNTLSCYCRMSPSRHYNQGATIQMIETGAHKSYNRGTNKRLHAFNALVGLVCVQPWTPARAFKWR